MRMDIGGGVEVSTTTPRRQRYGESSSVSVTFADSLILGATYNVTAHFRTFAEHDLSISEPVQSSKIFGKYTCNSDLNLYKRMKQISEILLPAYQGCFNLLRVFITIHYLEG